LRIDALKAKDTPPEKHLEWKGTSQQDGRQLAIRRPEKV
jgi:hypothetical protein